MKAGKTLSYYNENAKEFAERTVDVDFSENYSMFLGKLKKVLSDVTRSIF